MSRNDGYGLGVVVVALLIGPRRCALPAAQEAGAA